VTFNVAAKPRISGHSTLAAKMVGVKELKPPTSTSKQPARILDLLATGTEEFISSAAEDAIKALVDRTTKLHDHALATHAGDQVRLET
jgi:hypothetical protein